MSSAWTIALEPEWQHRLVALGLVLWVVVALWRSRRYEIWWPYVSTAIFAVLASAALFARLQAILVGDLAAPWWNPISPGYATFGLFAGALLGLVAMTRWTEVSFFRLVDVLLPGGLLALSLTRLGCLFRGCDFGRPAEIGVVYLEGAPAFEVHLARSLIESGAIASQTVHALPVYLSIAAFGGAVLGIVVSRVEAPGRAIWGALFYFVTRACFEVFRDASSVWHWSGFNANVILSVAGALCCVALLRASKNEDDLRR